MHFRNKFNKFINRIELMLDSIYHMTLKLLEIRLLFLMWGGGVCRGCENAKILPWYRRYYYGLQYITSGLSIFMHIIISLTDTPSYLKYDMPWK